MSRSIETQNLVCLPHNRLFCFSEISILTVKPLKTHCSQAFLSPSCCNISRSCATDVIRLTNATRKVWRRYAYFSVSEAPDKLYSHNRPSRKVSLCLTRYFAFSIDSGQAGMYMTELSDCPLWTESTACMPSQCHTT